MVKEQRRESAIIFILVFMFQILERIKEVLEKVPRGTTPNVLNYYLEHSLTIKNMLLLNTVFGRYQSKAHFLINEQGKKSPNSGIFVPPDSFLWEKYCFKLLFVLIMD